MSGSEHASAPSNNSHQSESSDQDREETAEAFQEIKEDITAPTGDIDEELERLDVEVHTALSSPLYAMLVAPASASQTRQY